jgi:gamma-glutamyltranspeptidase/glutathione hydrolase
MVVTDEHYATEIGAAVLARGGNAVDAAVAVGYALAVVDPCCGNIGGGGFMLLRLADGRERFIDFRERAPLGATRDMFLDPSGNVKPGASTRGYLAVGIPGTVKGLEHARVAYGTRTRRELMQPAIDLARDGFTLGAGDVAIFKSGAQDLTADPIASKLFLVDAHARAIGEVLRQPELARTLDRIARDGAAAFYSGPIARAIVSASAANGGILTMADFAAYTAEERTPQHCRYRGYDLLVAPPPSSGGTTLCEIAGILDGFPQQAGSYGSALGIARIVEAERRAYADRNTYLGDPDFVRNPVAQLLAPRYLAKLRAQIGTRATPSSKVHPGLGALREHNHTTHYSIVDRAGNAVAVTYTINDDFGAGVAAPETGFLLNNEMDDFTAKPGVPNLYGLVQGSVNEIAPGKRPLSSMAPTIVTKDGKLRIVAGSPGGSRIITITLGVLQHIIDDGATVQAAVDAPRIHHQWLPDTIYAEPGAITEKARRDLLRRGYRVTDNQPLWGAAEAILIDRAGTLHGASDRRVPAGSAAGPAR